MQVVAMARHEYRHKGKYVRISARKAHKQAQEKGISFPSFSFSLLLVLGLLCRTCEPKRGSTQSHSDREQRWRRSSFPDCRDDLVKTLCLCTVCCLFLCLWHTCKHPALHVWTVHPIKTPLVSHGNMVSQCPSQSVALAIDSGGNLPPITKPFTNQTWLWWSPATGHDKNSVSNSNYRNIPWK